MKAPEFRYGFHYGNCMPTRGGFAGRRDFFEVDAGPIKIDAICDPPFSRRSRISSFDFVGEAGHIYTMTVTEKKCIPTVTEKKCICLVIACNPFRKIE
jgi:hypothetical protein